MSQTTIEFLERLRQYIQNETSTQYKELERQWAHPLYERVAKGWAIEGLSVQGFKDNTSVTLRIEDFDCMLTKTLWKINVIKNKLRSEYRYEVFLIGSLINT